MQFLFKQIAVLSVVFLIVVKGFSQQGAKEEKKNERPLFLSYQPMVLFEMPRAGLKIGVEKIISPRVGIGLDAAYRMINYTESETLQPGESESKTGFQVQPELKLYFKNRKDKSGGGFNLRNSASLRLGYARYNDAFTTWVNIQDPLGNWYQKLNSYNRIQQNFDLSIMFSRKFYFSSEQTGWGSEMFSGIGVRQKIIDYENVSPELDAAELRQNDESATFSLLRETGYPLFIFGVRLFYRF